MEERGHTGKKRCDTGKKDSEVMGRLWVWMSERAQWKTSDRFGVAGGGDR